MRLAAQRYSYSKGPALVMTMEYGSTFHILDPVASNCDTLCTDPCSVSVLNKCVCVCSLSQGDIMNSSPYDAPERAFSPFEHGDHGGILAKL